MVYRFKKEDGSTIVEANPNWVRLDPHYPSFICCGESDAECVILSEGEEQKQYNLRTKRYADYDVVTYTRVQSNL